jgi:photoactive yellow protein
MTTLDFDDPELAAKADRMSQSELDALPYGVLKLDAEGRIVGYNQVEADIAADTFVLRIDDNFFTDIAPCMDNAYFRGRFDEGIRQGRLKADFEFESDDPHAQQIRVRMESSTEPHQYWVFIKRL